jgi:hypothetical protein
MSLICLMFIMSIFSIIRLTILPTTSTNTFNFLEAARAAARQRNRVSCLGIFLRHPPVPYSPQLVFLVYNFLTKRKYKLKNSIH